MNRFACWCLFICIFIILNGHAGNPESRYLKLSVLENNLNLGDIEPQNGEIIQYNAIHINILSDVNWVLSVYAQQELISNEGHIIPVENMSIGTAQNPFQHLENENAVIIASGMPTGPEGSDIYLDFRLILGKYNTAGDYSARLALELMPAF